MDDMEKLRVLLPHWMEHNDEHAADFVSWAEKASLTGHDDAAQMISDAADAIRQANTGLQAALDKLGGPLPGEPPVHTH